MEAGHAPAPAAARHVEADAVPRHDLAPELRVVDAAQEDPGVRLPVTRVQQQEGRDLGERLDHQHAGHQRGAGKVALEELLVDGDVLHRHDAPVRLVLGDVVHEERRVPVAQPVDQERDGIGLHSGRRIQGRGKHETGNGARGAVPRPLRHRRGAARRGTSRPRGWSSEAGAAGWTSCRPRRDYLAGGFAAAALAASKRLMISLVRSRPGLRPHDPGVGLAEEDVQPLLGRDLLDDRRQLALELELQLLLQVLHLGLGVLLQALDFDLEPLGFLLRGRAGFLAEEAAAVELLLGGLELLVLPGQLRQLLLAERVDLGGGRLALGRFRRDPRDVHEGDLGALGERARRRRHRGWRGRRLRRGRRRGGVVGFWVAAGGVVGLAWASANVGTAPSARLSTTATVKRLISAVPFCRARLSWGHRVPPSCVVTGPHPTAATRWRPARLDV